MPQSKIGACLTQSKRGKVSTDHVKVGIVGGIGDIIEVLQKAGKVISL